MQVKKNKILIGILWTGLLAGVLCSCGKGEDDGNQTAAGKEEASDSGNDRQGCGNVLPEGYALDVNYESAGGEAVMQDLHMLDGTLYYANAVEGQAIYRQKKGEEPQVLLGFEEDGDWLEGFAVGEEENLYLLLSDQTINTDAENYTLKRLDGERQEMYSVDTSAGLASAGAQYICELEVSAEGRVYGITRFGTVVFWDEKGEYQDGFSLMGAAEDMPEGCGLVNAGSKGVYAYITKKDEGRMQVQFYDLEAFRKLGKEGRRTARPLLAGLEAAPEPVTQMNGMNEPFHIFGAGENGIYLADHNRLWQMNLEDGSLEAVLAWKDAELKGEYVKGILRQEDGSFLAYLDDTVEKYHYWVTLMPVPVSQLPEKTELVLGVAGKQGYRNTLFSHMDQVVTSYNRTHPDCHVTIKLYEEGASDLQLELVQGKGPDVFLDRFSYFDMENLFRKGAVEDLAPYLADRKEDIIPGILDLITKDGRIPRIPLTFSPQVMIVSSDAPEGVMTPEELIEYIAGEEESYVDFMIWPNVLLNQILSGAEMDRYVDTENKSCSFDSEEFISLLEGLALLGERPKRGKLTERAEFMQTGKTNVVVGELENMGDYLSIRDSFLNVARITGFPTSSGEVRYPVALLDWLGINSASKHKEEAWGFIEFCLDYTSRADNANDRFVVIKDKFEQQIQYDTEVFTIVKWYPNYSDTVIDWESMPPVTREETDFLREISEHLYYYENAGLIRIIEEEAAAFFEGQKSARKVAELIQSRALLLNE